jgi:hypothetical protein
MVTVNCAPQVRQRNRPGRLGLVEAARRCMRYTVARKHCGHSARVAVSCQASPHGVV